MTTNVSPAVLQPGVVLTASQVSYITGAALSQTIIKRAVFANTTGGSVTITAWRLPSGGAALIIIPPRAVTANSTDLAPELANMVLNAGDAIQCEASAATSINFFASGFIAS